MDIFQHGAEQNVAREVPKVLREALDDILSENLRWESHLLLKRTDW